jgi:hypothetical protein
MKEYNPDQELDKLHIYMHYWIRMRFLEITLNTSYRNYFWNFDDFCNKKTTQTGMLMIDEWIWKYPELSK